MFKSKKNNNEEISVEFWTVVPGLSQVEEVVPVKQSSVLPRWWREAEYFDKSIKQCPSFPQMFSTSYIVPMWCDTEFSRDGDEIFCKTANEVFSWGHHTNSQFLDFAPDHIKEKYVAIAKPYCPWRLKTPKGYSVYQMPPFWHFNEKFTVGTGIIDTDFHHEINQQIFISIEDGESFVIERGTPLAVYFPFKRDKFTLTVREQTQEDFTSDGASQMIYSTKFINAYRDHKKFLERKND